MGGRRAYRVIIATVARLKSCAAPTDGGTDEAQGEASGSLSALASTMPEAGYGVREVRLSTKEVRPL